MILSSRSCMFHFGVHFYTIHANWFGLFFKLILLQTIFCSLFSTDNPSCTRELIHVFTVLNEEPHKRVVPLVSSLGTFSNNNLLFACGYTLFPASFADRRWFGEQLDNGVPDRSCSVNTTMTPRIPMTGQQVVSSGENSIQCWKSHKVKAVYQ